MFKSLSSSLIARGVLAVAVGVVALIWPQVTVLALVIMFAVYAFADGVAQLGLAFAGERAKPVVSHLLLALVDIAAGVVAVAWPAATALVLVLLVGSWAIVTGVIELVAAFQHGEPAGTRAMFVLAGLASVVFGVVLFARPDLGAVTLALLFGMFNVFVGAWSIAQGIQLRSADHELHEVVASTPEHVSA